MDVPPLPRRVRPTPANQVANNLETVLIGWLRQFRSVEPDTGLTPERLHLLALLVHGGPATPADLAAALRVSPPAISRMVTGLEEMGLVRRSSAGFDGRRVTVRALAAGARWMERGRANRIRSLARRLRRLSKNELLTLRRATRILGRLLAED